MTSAVYLIRKDMILSKKFLLPILLYYLLMAYTNIDSFSLFTLLPSLLLLINACSIDGSEMNQRYLLSLPLRRQQIVAAKYVSTVPFALLGFLSVVVIFIAATVMGKELGAGFWRETGLTTAAFPLLAAIYLPLYYWLGSKGSQYVNIVFMVVIMASSSVFANLSTKLPLINSWSDLGTDRKWLLYLIFAVAYVLILGCSYLISLRIYRNKDV
ncbi:ABC-2 transporter permease [Paenibacillus donghaensis]|uniref:ABC-2 transporter permease n=1 Tax=Paenibacillus donghaensis TaxID=414771 RepID=A0A2Z2KD50_9BACL|nr:ABC-2 transporter permease [Paenibacillus donghaensis]ASA21695.1 hypothetical protein B9T62_13515 [Paenibacillus donghaensis]